MFSNSNFVSFVDGLNYPSQQSYELKNRHSFRDWPFDTHGELHEATQHGDGRIRTLPQVSENPHFVHTRNFSAYRVLTRAGDRWQKQDL